MKRRDFITALGGAAAWPVVARAQQPSARDRVVWVHPSAPLADMQDNGSVQFFRAFLDELRQLGHGEGVNLILLL